MKEVNKFICPICGQELGWSTSEMLSDINDEYEGNETVNYYTCQNCGADVEVYECKDEEKHLYPFWKGFD